MSGNKLQNQIVKLTKDLSVNVSEDTRFLIDTSQLKESAVFEAVFDTQGVTAEIIGLYRLPKDNTVKFSTIANHQAPNTSCTTAIKGVLENGAQSDFVGKILIKKDAQNTSSFLYHNVLVIGDDTRNNSQPILEIEANDVKASHGATTGRLNEAELYYLKSRGLSTDEATDLIVSGFFESSLSKLDDDTLATNLKEVLSLL